MEGSLGLRRAHDAGIRCPLAPAVCLPHVHTVAHGMGWRRDGGGRWGVGRTRAGGGSLRASLYMFFYSASFLPFFYSLSRSFSSGSS